MAYDRNSCLNALSKNEIHIEKEFEGDLKYFAYFLRDKKILTNELYSSVTDPDCRDPKSTQAVRMYRRLYQLVEQDEKYFITFRDYLLKNEKYNDLLRNLDDAYKGEDIAAENLLLYFDKEPEEESETRLAPEKNTREQQSTKKEQEPTKSSFWITLLSILCNFFLVIYILLKWIFDKWKIIRGCPKEEVKSLPKKEHSETEYLSSASCGSSTITEDELDCTKKRCIIDKELLISIIKGNVASKKMDDIRFYLCMSLTSQQDSTDETSSTQSVSLKIIPESAISMGYMQMQSLVKESLCLVSKKLTYQLQIISQLNISTLVDHTKNTLKFVQCPRQPTSDAINSPMLMAKCSVFSVVAPEIIVMCDRIVNCALMNPLQHQDMSTTSSYGSSLQPMSTPSHFDEESMLLNLKDLSTNELPEVKLTESLHLPFPTRVRRIENFRVQNINFVNTSGIFSVSIPSSGINSFTPGIGLQSSPMSTVSLSSNFSDTSYLEEIIQPEIECNIYGYGPGILFYLLPVIPITLGLVSLIAITTFKRNQRGHEVQQAHYIEFNSSHHRVL